MNKINFKFGRLCEIVLIKCYMKDMKVKDARKMKDQGLHY